MHASFSSSPPESVSIVMPVLNEAASLEAFLRGLLPLREAGMEVILADGGSRDETLAIALPLADQVLNAPRGRARQMNAGAQAASGDILLFLHADTHLPEGAIETLVEQLAQSGKVWGRFDVKIIGQPFMLKIIGAMMNLRSRLTGIATGDQAMFVRREDFVAIGGFPDQPLMEDIEISKQLKRRSAPLCLRERVKTSGRRWEKYGLWRTIFLMWRLRFLYWCGYPAEKIAQAYK